MNPEIQVRRLVHSMGYRFRLHKKDLPGKPDLVFSRRRKVVFVHGCFWHQHQNQACKDSRKPTSNTGYWGVKLDRNRERDAANVAKLKRMGWKVLVVWECDLRNEPKVKKRVREFLNVKGRTARGEKAILPSCYIHQCQTLDD